MGKTITVVSVSWGAAFLSSFCVFLTVLGVCLCLLFIGVSRSHDIDGIGIGLAGAYGSIMSFLVAVVAGAICLPFFKYYGLTYWILMKWLGIVVGGLFLLCLCLTWLHFVTWHF